MSIHKLQIRSFIRLIRKSQICKFLWCSNPQIWNPQFFTIQPMGRERESLQKSSNERQNILWKEMSQIFIVERHCSFTPAKHDSTPAFYTERPRIELSLLFGNFSMKKNHSEFHIFSMGETGFTRKKTSWTGIRYFFKIS